VDVVVWVLAGHRHDQVLVLGALDLTAWELASKSEVSRVCSALDERVGAFRNRTLGSRGLPVPGLPCPALQAAGAAGVTASLIVWPLALTSEVLGAPSHQRSIVRP